jgi:dinuclear metal center YbgI/SA1388 family protein
MINRPFTGRRWVLDKLPAVPTLADVIAAFDALYDPRLAERWDAIGLICGDPRDDVRRVLFAVDPVAVVAEEALDWRADLLVTHHPLFLRPVHGVPASTAKGQLVHRLIKVGCALFVVHTNADNAHPGVSDALAEAVGLQDVRPLAPRPEEPRDKLVTFLPETAAEPLLDALADAGAGVIGAYDRCAFTTTGVGTFRPGPTATPTIGEPGHIEHVAEIRLEMVLPRSRRDAVVQALYDVHPYEEPAFDVYELAQLAGSQGLGRVGTLPTPETLGAFAGRVSKALPSTAWGMRVAGDESAVVREVAVCGGAGDSLLDTVRARGVDAFVTSDLRHHRASEALADGGPALVDVAHWASEWPWLVAAEQALSPRLADTGTTVETRVSQTRTDPWTQHYGET